MDEQISQDGKLLNQFDRMWMDSLLSLTPNSTYREAWNAVITSDEENSYGISNEPSNEIFVELPGEIRGMIYVEDRDQYVVFLDTEEGGEIGIIDEKGKCYERKTDVNIAKELEICQKQWIDAEVKITQPCNHLYLYWSSGDVYKRVNLDDPCCEFEDINLINPVCVAAIETDIIEQGGRLANGVYQFAAKARDIEGNDSNWSKISNAISISDGDHVPGDLSSKAINLRIRIDDNRDYHIVDLAVIRTIDNITSIEQFASVSTASGTDVINYVYAGITGQELNIQLSDILTRTNRYIRGRNLIQYDNRLVLYNLRPIHNLDYQLQANEIEARYNTYLVPLDRADQFKGLRNNENYLFAIHWNYTDGTSSVDYPLIGPQCDRGICDVYEDTSVRENTFIDGVDDALVDDVFEVDPSTDNTPTVLLEDESTSVIVTDDDEPTIQDEISEKYGEQESIDLTGNLDCLCDKAAAIASDGPGTFAGLFSNVPIFGNLFGSWDMDDDVIGAITLSQVLCMCENRQSSSENPGEIPDPGTPEGEFYATLVIDNVGTTLQVNNGMVTQMIEALEKSPITTADNRSEGTAAVIGARCSNEGDIKCSNNVCYTCQGGVWSSVNNVDSYPTDTAFSKGVVGQSDVLARASGSNIQNLNHSELGFEYEYAEDGCTVIGVRPLKYTDGTFGCWTTQEVYPETLNCECDYIYGALAGQNVRLHKVPSVTKEPHFVSFSSGVPNKYDMANSEFRDTFMVMVGVEFSNITLPVNPPKPICHKNPYTITFAERTEANKTVIGSGLAHSCFLGEIAGEDYAIPKHALNSFERFDRNIEPSGPSTFRGGRAIDVGAYVLHSPDFHMRRPPLDATECLIEMEMHGKGFRHGIMAPGEKPESQSQDRLNQKGTRQAINVNHYDTFDHPIVRSVRSMSRAPSDSIVSRANRFTYNLCNLNRESCTYVELDGQLEQFVQGDAEQGMTTLYGGIPGAAGDNASDRSFTGDIYTDSLPIHSARGHLMTFIRRLPNQYGSLISRAYIPLGLEADSFSPTISGLVGDSFVGPMTYKRTANVSDKTNRMISRFVLPDGISGDGIIARVLGNLMASLFRVLGLRNGGYIPLNQDGSDHIRVFGGLRFINPETVPLNGAVANPGEFAQGAIPPQFPVQDPSYTTRTNPRRDVNFGDNYFPQILKTQLTSYFNSDVNLHYRQLGPVENGEVYYSEDSSTLKGLSIDSSIPQDTPWSLGWLNRWYSEWKENAKWKLIIQGVLTFLFTYMIALWLIVKGIGYVVNGFQAVGGGMYALQTIGGLLGVFFGIVLVFLGIFWMRYWVNSDADNKIIEEYVGLKNIRPDRRNVDGSFSMNENRFRQFENNYWKCDNTHSQVNSWEVSYGMSDPYFTCSCPTVYTNEILYSNRQDSLSHIDFWRNFKPNNSLQISTEHGQIQKMFKLGNVLYAHTTDMLIRLHNGGGGFSFNDSDLLLGTGNLFSVSSPIYGGVVEGFAGLSDPNSAEVTGYGYVFPDREARKWYTFTGSLPQPISNAGVQHFFQENMQFELLERFPSFELVDLKLRSGIGYSFGIDHENYRMLFTKVDYRPIYDEITLNSDNVTFDYKGETIALGDPKYFDNVSFTLSYDVRKSAWVSLHNYHPVLYGWNRFDMYSFNKVGMWRHNVKGHFQTFYGQFYPFSVEYSANNPRRDDSFTYNSTTLSTEAYKWKVNGYISTDTTFDQMIAYNSDQITGVKDFIDTRDLSYADRSKQFNDKVRLEYKDRIWSFKDISDYAISNKEFLFQPDTTVGPLEVNTSNVSDNSTNNTFYDNFFANRLIFSKFDDVKLLLKRVETDTSYDSR